MKKLALLMSLALILAGCTAKQESQIAVNPLTYTDIPDNDVIRVGDDYYMVSTTMFFCPGAPIMHSKDLVHWRIVSYIFDTLEDDDVYNLRNGRNAYGQGQWATSLRYHDGMYYALFVANDQHKTYIFKTRDIVGGPWEKTVLDGFFHDASLLFDDGHLYLVYGNGDLRMTELEPDGSAVKKDAVDQVIISAPREGYGLRAEGAHFYHIGDYYYVLEIDWPIGEERTATIWRSENVRGPYTSKVVLKGTLGGRADGIAQGPIVDTPSGEWYAIQFQDHGAVGRIPTIQRVTWVDGWPIMGDNTVPEENVTVNLPSVGEDYVWASDEFDSTELALVWQWNHKAPEGWSLTRKPGYLSLHAERKASGIADAVGTLTQRTVGPRSFSETLLDFSSLKDGDEAGICAFQSMSARAGVKAEDGVKYLVCKEKEKEIFRIPLPDEQKKVYLRIKYVFTAEEEDGCPDDTAFLDYSFDGEKWTRFDYALQMKYTLDYFTGYRSALYCFSTEGEGGYADFDYFRQRVF
ncbi:MAG: glycoside hydrolase 43 family protein [Bacteroidales bacterium]|nr:glycoside hydrolase 43 family protein [Bacteroidales bacterium]